MARIAGIDLPKNKRGEIGLTYIYGIGRSTARYILEKANIDVNTLADYNHLLELAVAKNYITENELHTLQEWRVNPSNWKV